MAFKLKKNQIKELEALIVEVREKAEITNAAILVYNEKVAEVFDPLLDAQANLNEAQEILKGWINENVLWNWNMQICEKSEKWRDGELASSVERLIGEWELLTDNLDPIEFDQPETFSEIKLSILEDELPATDIAEV